MHEDSCAIILIGTSGPSPLRDLPETTNKVHYGQANAVYRARQHTSRSRLRQPPGASSIAPPQPAKTESNRINTINQTQAVHRAASAPAARLSRRRTLIRATLVDASAKDQAAGGLAARRADALINHIITELSRFCGHLWGCGSPLEVVHKSQGVTS